MSSMARMFMEITGVAGESADEMFKDQIEIDSWDWDLARNASDIRGEIEPSVFRFNKRMDVSSPRLLNTLKSTSKISATCTMLEDSDLPFKLVVFMQNVRVVKYTVNGDDDDECGQVNETWTLNYDTIGFSSATDTLKHGTVTVPSQPIFRHASASTEKTDPVQEVIDLFLELDSPDQSEVLIRIKNESPDARKVLGPLAKPSDAPKSIPKFNLVDEVVRGFEGLKSSADRRKAAERIFEKFPNLFVK